MNVSIFSSDNLRLLVTSILSYIVAFFTPTKDFYIMLIIMFAFNLFCGMRADGITLVRCKNFSWNKFKDALVELLLYLLIIQVLFTVMDHAGDNGSALVLLKTISYIFCYGYFQNGLKNLIIAYPKIKMLRIIYHLIRFEFLKAMPAHVSEAIDKLDKEEENATNK